MDEVDERSNDELHLLENPILKWFQQIKMRGMLLEEEDEESAGDGAAAAAEGSLPPPAPLILIAVGKCGVGKSAFANQIYGKPIFESRLGAASVTHAVQVETVDCCLAAGGCPVVVVDTIGFGDPDHGPELTQTALREQLEDLEETSKCVEGVRW